MYIKLQNLVDELNWLIKELENIKNVSIKTIGKMAALNAIYSASFTAFNGLFTNGVVLNHTY